MFRLDYSRGEDFQSVIEGSADGLLDTMMFFAVILYRMLTLTVELLEPLDATWSL
jgi:hypothetical protein